MRIEFNQSGTFQALYAAQAWCRENGISFGQSCATGPTGLLFGKFDWIAKWRNLTQKERSDLDGIMSGDFREGPVVIALKDDAVQAHQDCMKAHSSESVHSRSPAMTKISIHNLAVLRAVVEGREEIGTYFGSFGALDSWVSSTRDLGLIDHSGVATAVGASLASQLNLSNQGVGRAYLWKNATELEKKAQVLLGV